MAAFSSPILYVRTHRPRRHQRSNGMTISRLTARLIFARAVGSGSIKVKRLLVDGRQELWGSLPDCRNNYIVMFWTVQVVEVEELSIGRFVSAPSPRAMIYQGTGCRCLAVVFRRSSFMKTGQYHTGRDLSRYEDVVL